MSLYMTGVEPEKRKRVYKRKKMNTVKVKLLTQQAYMPARVTKGSAGYDVQIPADYKLKYGRQLIKVGWALAMPKNLALDCRPRSGYSMKGMLAYTSKGKEIRINADVKLGLIDSDYRNEVGIILNVRDWRVWFRKLFLHKGQAVAQMKFCVVPETELIEAEELNETERKGGFGHMNNE